MQEQMRRDIAAITKQTHERRVRQETTTSYKDAIRQLVPPLGLNTYYSKLEQLQRYQKYASVPRDYTTQLSYNEKNQIYDEYSFHVIISSENFAREYMDMLRALQLMNAQPSDVGAHINKLLQEANALILLHETSDPREEILGMEVWEWELRTWQLVALIESHVKDIDEGLQRRCHEIAEKIATRLTRQRGIKEVHVRELYEEAQFMKEKEEHMKIRTEQFNGRENVLLQAKRNKVYNKMRETVNQHLERMPEEIKKRTDSYVVYKRKQTKNRMYLNHAISALKMALWTKRGIYAHEMC